MAEKLYRFQDAHGNMLLTNEVTAEKKPKQASNRQYKTLVKVTWYPDTNVHAYGNWGSQEADIKPSASKNRHAFDEHIRSAAQRYQLDFGLIKAVVHTESGFDPRAKSGPGAQGLMQLMPATAAQYKLQNVWDPRENIITGSRHLRYLLDRYGRLDLALAAYNAGPGNVDKYQGIPPFPETQDYVRRVMSRYQNLYKDADGRVATSTQSPL